MFIGDVQTGKNVLGAGGLGITLYFNDYVDLIVGPVFYTDKDLQPGRSSYLWTVQLDIDVAREPRQDLPYRLPLALTELHARSASSFVPR